MTTTSHIPDAALADLDEQRAALATQIGGGTR